MAFSGYTVCRLCLSNGHTDSMVPLVNKSKENLTCYGISLVQLSLTEITILDDLPQHMCKNCLIQLKQLLAFKLKCENSMKTLNKLKITLQEYNIKSRLQEEIIQHAMFINSGLHLLDQNLCDLDFCDNSLSDHSDKSKGFSKNEEAHTTNTNPCCYNRECSPIMPNPSEETKLLSRLEEFVESQLRDNENIDILNASEYPEHTDLTDSAQQLNENKTLGLIEKMFAKCPKRFSVYKTKNLTCKTCKKTFSHQNIYIKHRKTHYEVKYICEHCGKGFKFQAELNLHTVSVHSTGSYIQCKKCPFKAAKKFLLVEHERLHTGERPFACEKCGLTFRRQAILRNHERYHREKTVQCIHCTKKFFTKWHMLTHVNNSHQRSYLYLCPVCGVKYAKNSTVRKHLMEKHGVSKHLQGKIARVRL